MIRTVFPHAASETLDTGRGAARYALRLARAFDAHLEALVSHSRFRDFLLGGATRTILAAPRLPSLLAH